MRQHSTTCCWREGWTSSIRSSLDHQLLASSSSTRPKLSGTSCMKELPNMASTAAAAAAGLQPYKTCYIRINSYQNLNWVLFHGFIPSLYHLAKTTTSWGSSPLPMSYMCRVNSWAFFFPWPWGSFASDTNSGHWVLCFLLQVLRIILSALVVQTKRTPEFSSAATRTVRDERYTKCARSHRREWSSMGSIPRMLHGKLRFISTLPSPDTHVVDPSSTHGLAKDSEFSMNPNSKGLLHSFL